jgi:hypothetical protein
MSWREILKAQPEKMLHFPEEALSFSEIAEDLYHIDEDFIVWNALWTKKSVVEFFSALDSGASIFPSHPELEIPPEAKAMGKGWLFLKSSGTMGASRWIAHPLESLRELKPLYSGKSSALLLKPGHAAGIEALVTGIMGGNELFFLSEAAQVERLAVDVLHAPPQVLGFLLSFTSKYSLFLSRLKIFYNGTDVLHDLIVEKLGRSPFDFELQQIYGSSETWRIETETHPDRPQLFRITDPHVKIINQEVCYSSGKLAKFEFGEKKKNFPETYSLKDIWGDEGEGWGRLEPRRSWIANFHGKKLNLFDLENRLMGIAGVGDARINLQNNPMGSLLLIELFVTEDLSLSGEELQKIIGLQASQYLLKTAPYTAPFAGKRQRQKQ